MTKKINPFIEQTVVLIKPDGVKRGIVGEVITRFERLRFTIKAAKLIWVDSDLVGKHYSDSKEYCIAVGKNALKNYKLYGLDPMESIGSKKPYEVGKKIREWNMEFISSGPVFALLLEGPQVVKIVRKMVGSLFPLDSAPGTIRGDYATDSFISSNTASRTAENIIHASGSPKEAEFERKLWFKEKEIYSY